MCEQNSFCDRSCLSTCSVLLGYSHVLEPVLTANARLLSNSLGTHLFIYTQYRLSHFKPCQCNGAMMVYVQQNVVNKRKEFIIINPLWPCSCHTWASAHRPLPNLWPSGWEFYNLITVFLREYDSLFYLQERIY